MFSGPRGIFNVREVGGGCCWEVSLNHEQCLVCDDSEACLGFRVDGLRVWDLRSTSKKDRGDLSLQMLPTLRQSALLLPENLYIIPTWEP